MYCVCQLRFSTSPMVNTELLSPSAPDGGGKLKSFAAFWVTLKVIIWTMVFAGRDQIRNTKYSGKSGVRDVGSEEESHV